MRPRRGERRRPASTKAEWHGTKHGGRFADHPARILQGRSIMNGRFCTTLGAAGLLLAATAAGGATVYTMPATTLPVHLTYTVLRQAQVIVPAGISFDVHDISVSTTSAAVSVTTTGIIVYGNFMHIGLSADAASFTPPVTGATTWASTSVVWSAATWDGGTGVGRALSSTTVGDLVSCSAHLDHCSTTNLVFTLVPNTSVKRAGLHTITARFKFYYF
jgi:hypothetical protein